MGKRLKRTFFLLKDGNIVILHHRDLDLDMSHVEQMTLEEVDQHRKTNAENVRGNTPLLREYLFNGFDRGIVLELEIKSATPEGAKKNIHAVLSQILKLESEGVFKDSSYVSDSVSISSFSIEALKEAKEEMDRAEKSFDLGLLWTSTKQRADDMEISQTAQFHAERLRCGDDWLECGLRVAKEIGCASIHLHISILTPELIEKAHHEGLRVSAWGIDGQEAAERVIEMGADKCIYEPLAL